MTRAARWLVTAMMVAVSMPLAAETIYKWVDKDGGVHFSNTPPPGQAVESEDLRYFHGDPAAAAAAQKQQQELIKQRREEQSKSAEAATQASADAAKNRERCEQARAVMTRMQGDPVVRYKQEDGS